MWFLVFFGVHDTAATRGQYLALSKAWRSCIGCMLCILLWCRRSGRRFVSLRHSWRHRSRDTSDEWRCHRSRDCVADSRRQVPVVRSMTSSRRHCNVCDVSSGSVIDWRRFQVLRRWNNFTRRRSATRGQYLALSKACLSSITERLRGLLGRLLDDDEMRHWV